MSEKIKINLNKYVARDTLHKIDARYIILLGGRNNGKSFATKEDVIKNFLEKGEEFAYVRRYKEDCKQYMVQEYFADIIFKNVIFFILKQSEISIRCHVIFILVDAGRR